MSLNNQHAERLREMAKEPRRKAEAARRDQKENHDGGYLALAVMSSLAADSYELDAAALLAGAEALERLEAMESTSSTMLPKSASGSEVGND